MERREKDELILGDSQKVASKHFLKLEDFISLILGIVVLVAFMEFLQSFNYSGLNIIVIFLVIVLLSELMAAQKYKNNLLYSPLAFVSLAAIAIVSLFKIESIFIMAHFIDYDSFSYPRHSYIPHISLYIFIFLTLCFILISFFRITVATRNVKFSTARINKATELIKACSELKEFRSLVILSFWLILFVMVLSYSLAKESYEEGASLYIVYALVEMPLFFFPVSFIGLGLATRKVPKSISAMFVFVLRMVGYVILLEISLIALIVIMGWLF